MFLMSDDIKVKLNHQVQTDLNRKKINEKKFC